jgi:hypothetical protein
MNKYRRVFFTDFKIDTDICKTCGEVAVATEDASKSGNN